MSSKRTKLILSVIAFFAVVFFSIAYASGEKDYPNRPIEMIITYPPGGPIDSSARLIERPLQDALGVTVVLTTKGGVGGALGTDFVAKSKPDGYTLGVIACSSLTTGPAINPALPYKYTDLAPVCLLWLEPLAIIGRPGAPWKDLKGLVQYARENPGKMNYGTAGYGSIGMFAVELLKMNYGLDIIPVHFRGSGPALTAVLGGHVDLAAVGYFTATPQVKAGKAILLATTAKKRVSDFPDTPTMKELGISEAPEMWGGLFAPSKTPQAVMGRLGREMEKIMKSPTLADHYKRVGLTLDYRDSVETLKLIEGELKAVKEVVERLGIR